MRYMYIVGVMGYCPGSGLCMSQLSLGKCYRIKERGEIVCSTGVMLRE